MPDIDKEKLHDELDALLPVNEDDKKSKRSGIRAIGHCLIELGLLTSIECGYEHCVMDDRKFERDPDKQGGGRKWLTLDHVVELCDGGTDMPSNLQFMHLGCNSSKGAKAYFADPERKKEHAILNGKRYKDPEYIERVSASQKATLASPESKAKRSAMMKARWSDPEFREKRHESAKASWTPERRQKHSESIRKSWADGELRKHRSEASKKRRAQHREDSIDKDN